MSMSYFVSFRRQLELGLFEVENSKHCTRVIWNSVGDYKEGEQLDGV